MYIDLLLLLVGLVILILGGDSLVRGASSIAIRLNISPLVVGLTIVAFGTSAPELFISLKSALKGSPDLAMGNVIGSNICNLALVLGVTALIYPVEVNTNSLKIDWPMTMGSSLLLYFLVREGYVDSHEGIIFVTILAFYTFFIIRKSRKDTKTLQALEAELDIDIDKIEKRPVYKDLVFIALGCTGLYFGSEWFVGGAQNLALALGVSERIVGLTVIAIGTSLPELVTACIASFKRETDIAIGNLMGSNIFNILSILGITSIVKEIAVSDEIIDSDMLWMLGITLIILPMMFFNKKISRMEGAVLLSIYGLYNYFLFT
jgi:cation:H+ antiporter